MSYQINDMTINNPEGIGTYDLTGNPARKKKSKIAIIALSATICGGAFGGLTLINPLLSKPAVKNGKYAVEDSVLTYEFKVTKTKNYECDLTLFRNEEAVATVLLPEAKTYQGTFELKEKGEYELYFKATNKVDYTKRTKLYSFTF